MILVHLSKQQALEADPKAIQQINFAVNLERVYFILEEAKSLRLFTRNCKNFVNATLLNAIPLNNLIFINIK